MNNLNTKHINLFFGVILLLLLPNVLYSQNDSLKSNFNVIVSVAIGDLNKDKLLDSVVVTQDTINKFAPYRLEVFFAKSNGVKKMIQTEKAILPQFPDGRDGYFTGNGFTGISIKGGVLWIEMELTRGHFEHKFRYQNSKFELIGYSWVESNGIGEILFIDFNLSTGKRIETTEFYGDEIEESKPKVVTEKIIKLNPLPDLSNFEPFTNDLY